MEFSTKEIIIGLLGSAGVVGALVSIFTLITARLDKRRERLAAERKDGIHDSVEMKRLEFERDERYETAVTKELWALIDSLKADLAKTEKELETERSAGSFSRPTVTKVYRMAREIREEIAHMNVLMLTQEQTEVFNRRFGRIKELADGIEDALP